MPPMEYKVLKMPHNRQEFYSYFLRSFGWQVQGMSENVDRVDTRSFGTTLSTGTGHQNATFWHHPYTNNTTMSGRTHNYGWSSQMGNQTTKVKTALSVTYQRDLSMPNYDRLAQLEAQCWPYVNQYFARLDSGEADNTNWTSWQHYAYLSKKAQNILQSSALPGVQATGRFHTLDASHGSGSTTFTLSFSLQNRKDMNCLVMVHFTNDEGNSLRDEDACYDDRQGNVAVTHFVRPRYDDSRWDGFKLTIPWDQLHVKKREETVRYRAVLWDLSTDSEIVRTSPSRFSFSRSLFGKVEVTGLPAGALESIGHLPEPQRRDPAQTRLLVTASPPSPVADPAQKRSQKQIAGKPEGVPEHSSKKKVTPPAETAAPDTREVQDAYGEIGKVKIVHNVVDSGRPGMQVQADVLVRRRKGIQCRYEVLLLDHFGNPLKDMNRQYCTSAGDVCATCSFVPDSDEDRIKGLTVFVPYEELDLPDGEYDLRLSAALHDEVKDTTLAAYDRVFFFYTQSGDMAKGRKERSFEELIKAHKGEEPSK